MNTKWTYNNWTPKDLPFCVWKKAPSLKPNKPKKTQPQNKPKTNRNSEKINLIF